MTQTRIVLVFSMIALVVGGCTSLNRQDPVFDPATDEELQQILEAFEPPITQAAKPTADHGIRRLFGCHVSLLQN